MDRYIVVVTLCDKKDIANRIIDRLLDEHLVAGSQIYECNSKYWWGNSLEETHEYRLEFRTKEHLFKKIEEEIKNIHDYETCEISSYELVNGSKEIFDWIDKNIL